MEHPEEESILLALAWAYHDGAEWEKAIDCFELLFEKELARSVFTGFAYDELVRIYKETRQHDRLTDVCERAVHARPQDTALLGELAEAYLKAGRVRDSVSLLEKIISLKPDGVSAYCLLGEALAAGGSFAEAEAAYRRATEMEPQAASSFYSRLADCFLKAGEHERAEKAFRNCLEIETVNPLYHCGLGDSLIRQGRLTEAKAAYETAIALSPASADGFYNRWGNSLASAHYHHEAIEVFQKALEKDCGNDIFRLRIAGSFAALKSSPSS